MRVVSSLLFISFVLNVSKLDNICTSRSFNALYITRILLRYNICYTGWTFFEAFASASTLYKNKIVTTRNVYSYFILIRLSFFFCNPTRGLCGELLSFPRFYRNLAPANDPSRRRGILTPGLPGFRDIRSILSHILVFGGKSSRVIEPSGLNA